MANIQKAVQELAPNCSFNVSNNSYAGLEWLDGNPLAKPSEEDVNAKVAEIETRDGHISPRVRAYPSIQDQLDMQYHDNVDGTTTWKDAIQAIKDAHPKA